MPERSIEVSHKGYTCKQRHTQDGYTRTYYYRKRMILVSKGDKLQKDQIITAINRLIDYKQRDKPVYR